MLNFLNNPFKYKHFGYAAALALGLISCEQQTVEPAPKVPALTQMQPNRYYLNTQPSTKTVIEQLDPKIMLRVDVLKGQQAADYTHDAGVNGVILVQTQ